MTDLFKHSEDMASACFGGIVTKRAPSTERSRWFRASTPDLDRHGAIIKTEGINLDNYMNNPIFGWAHDVYWEGAPMEHVIGKTINFEQTDTYLDTEVHFVEQDVHPYGEMALRMLDGGYLNMVSVGIMRINSGYQTIDGSEIYVYEESELLEHSLVPIPANPNAQTLNSLKSMLNPLGFDINKFSAAPSDKSEADIAATKSLSNSVDRWNKNRVSRAFERY